MNILEVNDLGKTYPGGAEAVRGITFAVPRGEIFGILGPNGAGKTTTLEMLETLIPITRGSATIAGFDVAREPESVKRQIGVQPQAPGFQDKTTPAELLELFAAAYGERIDPSGLLGDVGLESKAHSYIEELSGSQKQRLSIAAALVHSPALFFMDEPTTGLDPQARRNLWELVRKVRDRGITVVLTTHYMDEAEYLCDRVAIMDEGKIIALDSPAELVRALLSRGFEKEQAVERANLEDVFIDLTGKDLRE